MDQGSTLAAGAYFGCVSAACQNPIFVWQQNDLIAQCVVIDLSGLVLA